MSRVPSHQLLQKRAWTVALIASGVTLGVLLLFPALRITRLYLPDPQEQELKKEQRERLAEAERRRITPQEVRKAAEELERKRRERIRESVQELREQQRRLNELREERMAELERERQDKRAAELLAKARAEAKQLEQETLRLDRDPYEQLQEQAEELAKESQNIAKIEEELRELAQQKLGAHLSVIQPALDEMYKLEPPKDTPDSAKLNAEKFAAADQANKQTPSMWKTTQVIEGQDRPDLRRQKDNLTKLSRDANQIPEQQIEKIADNLRKRADVIEKERAGTVAKGAEEIKGAAEKAPEFASAPAERLGAEAQKLAETAQAVKENVADQLRASAERLDEIAGKVKASNQQTREMRESPLAKAAEQLADQTEALPEDLGNPAFDPAIQNAEKLAENLQAEAETQSQTPESGEMSPSEPTQMQQAAQTAAQLEQTLKDLKSGNLDRAFQTPSEQMQVPETNLDQLSTAELYEHAQQLEDKAREDFADFRSAELAMLQDENFQDLRASAELADQQHPDLAPQLEQHGQPQNTEELAALGKVLDQAGEEVDRMRMGTQALMQQAGSIAGKGEQGTSVQLPGSGEGAAGRSRQIQQSIQSSVSGQGGSGSLDLSGAMGAIYQAQGAGDGRGGDWGGAGGSFAEILGKDDNREDGGEHMTAGVKEMDTIRVNGEQILAEVLPGRRFSRSSNRQGWLYIDTWYVIGPWENGGGQDFDPPLPPEMLVDFDATYQGKGNRQLAWKFLQSNTPRVKPFDERSNSTYYGYTEVYADEELDVLVALASDDMAKLWINDIVVWQDSGLSPWSIDEGFRKIRFRRGNNRILLRIENGPAVCHFSLVLCPAEAFQQEAKR